MTTCKLHNNIVKFVSHSMHNICIGVPSGVMMSSFVLGMSLMKCTALKVDYQVTYSIETQMLWILSERYVNRGHARFYR